MMETIQQPQTAPEGVPRVDDVSDVDLSDAASYVAGPPHGAFDAIRAASPIAWQDERPPAAGTGAELLTGQPAPYSPGFWAITGHALVTEISKDPSRFSSYVGGVQMETFDESLLAGLRLMLLYMDPPDQNRIRKLLVPSFTPRSIDQMKEAVSANAKELADAVAAATSNGETVDLVAMVTKELPTRTLAVLLGMPEEDWHLIPAWSDSLIAGQSSEATVEEMMGSVATFQEIHDYGSRIFAERREHPVDDIVSSLATAEVDGERLTVEDFCMFWLLLIVAGNETTRNSLSGSVVALHEHGLWASVAQQLRDSGEPLSAKATDELVRYVSPVMQFRRTATRDQELGGQQIRAGDKLVLWYGAANRDPQVFADPHRLDLDREPNPHVAFGIGPHFCLGTRLARLQISTMLTELLTRFPDLTLDGDPTYVASNFIHGIEHLPAKVG